jgi:hypothetical protein
LLGELGDFDKSRKVGGVEFVGLWQENRIDSAIAQKAEVAFEILWVDRQILLRAKLKRVDEDADDGALGGFAAVVDQAEMSRVQKTHCGYQAQLQVAAPPGIGSDLHF